MEILGIGMPELVFIFIIALLILGPKDMQKAGKTVGRWLNKFIKSDIWRVMRSTTNEIRNLPGNLMKEANLEMQKTDEEIRRELKQHNHYSKFVAPDFDDRSNQMIGNKQTESENLKPGRESEGETKNDA
ncbi:MAG: twin-arginine translocase TatA/TatE family subunit [Anaerolineales bacterium]|nr:MAG: hypothetical protein EDM79_01485 [Chloroflexota bacterium]MBE7432393.1 twin-arginine translocase TatA/TatE family subunit [Anaerolineales bacterium]MCE7860689.1 hypothetical protein [Chloroflexi bacterium CFX2]MCK6582178.1 twin-arginine translocase TatA/TatE family subunit [Anaerolineales bacterium]GJQ36326.1 MAG: hypothetical protein JETCAE01_23360 [Anaerolineaceae bacterium]